MGLVGTSDSLSESHIGLGPSLTRHDYGHLLFGGVVIILFGVAVMTGNDEVPHTVSAALGPWDHVVYCSIRMILGQEHPAVETETSVSIPDCIL